MPTVRVHAEQIDSGEMYYDVAEVIAAGDREIRSATAVSIASMWNETGSLAVLGRFSSGDAVELRGLSDAIADVRDRYGYHDGQMSKANRDALDCLVTFAIAAALRDRGVTR